MQVTIEIDGALLRRGALCAITLAGVLALSRAHASNVTLPNTFAGGTTISAAQMNANFSAVKTAVDDNHARIAALEAQVTALTTLLAGVSRPAADTIEFAGVNVQIVNGSGSTTTGNGVGNLILGYSQNALARARTGSHNVVVGDDHGYTSVAGLIVGSQHLASGEGPCVLGGALNEAGDRATVLGGHMNRAVAGLAPAGPAGAVIVGGRSNVVSGVDSVVVGGEGGTVDADPTSPGVLDGELVTMVGVHPSNGTQLGSPSAALNRVVSIGTNAVGMDVGGWAHDVSLGGTNTYVGNPAAPAQAVYIANAPNATIAMGQGAVSVIVGDGATNVNVGNGVTNTLSIGEAANGVNVGNNGGNVRVGDQAGNASLGNFATTVNVGNGVTDAVYVGNGARIVFVGDGATDSVNVGNAAELVNVGIGATSVQVGNAAGTLTVGIGAGAVGYGP